MKEKKLQLVFALLVASLLTVTIMAQNSDNKRTVEERLVEMAYNKMSVLDTSERLQKAKSHGRPADASLENPKLKFKLRDFRVGDVSEIMNWRYRELVTAPTGEILSVTTIETKDRGGEGKISIQTDWKAGQYSSGADPLWTIADVFNLEAVRFSDVGRYASYEVTVSFEGKKRTYRELALFHNRNRTDGNLNPEILDSISGSGGVLTQILKDKRLPVGARRGREAQLTQPQQELQQRRSVEASFPVSKGKVKGGSDSEMVMSSLYSGGGCLEWDYNPFYYWEMYGDPFSAECLVWDFFFPVYDAILIGGGGLPQCVPTTSRITADQIFDPDRNHHLSGNHYGRSQFESVCQLLSTCQTTCQVNILTQAHGDTGETDEYLYYHVGT
jgi:hypothetical protein